MTKEEREKLKLGMACCIQANRTHQCPEECPYDDEGETYCEGMLLLDTQLRIAELERAVKRLREPKPARLLTLKELQTRHGHGYEECYFLPDDEEVEPAHTELMECVFIRGQWILPDGNIGSVNAAGRYNVRGFWRIWEGDIPPTREEMEAAAWLD